MKIKPKLRYLPLLLFNQSGTPSREFALIAVGLGRNGKRTGGNRENRGWNPSAPDLVTARYP
jgi:hypothetical protein